MEEIDALLALDPLPEDIADKVEAIIKTAPAEDRSILRRVYSETLHLLRSDGSEELLPIE